VYKCHIVSTFFLPPLNPNLPINKPPTILTITYTIPNNKSPFLNIVTVSTLRVENVVNEPTKPVPIALAAIGEIEILLNKSVVNQANKKLPNKLTINVV